MENFIFCVVYLPNSLIIRLEVTMETIPKCESCHYSLCLNFEFLKDFVIYRSFQTDDLLCGCSAKYLRNWIIASQLESNIRVTCSSPIWLKDRSIKEVLDSELVCGKFGGNFLLVVLVN